MNEPRIEHSTDAPVKASYYALHKQVRDAAHARWLAKNREKWNAYMREYRRRKHGMG